MWFIMGILSVIVISSLRCWFCGVMRGIFFRFWVSVILLIFFRLRSIIVCNLFGFEDVILMGLCGLIYDECSWIFDFDFGGWDLVFGYEWLQEVYFARFFDYLCGIIVLMIVDVEFGQVVINDYLWIIYDFFFEWCDFYCSDVLDLWFDDFCDEMEDVMDCIYCDVNNGVYCAGFFIL